MTQLGESSQWSSLDREREREREREGGSIRIRIYTERDRTQEIVTLLVGT